MTKNFLTGLLIALTIISSGCLKDEKYSEIDKTSAIVEFPIGGPGVVENSFDVTDISKNLDTSVAINIASPQLLDRDVKVTVRVTPTIVTEFNTVNGTAYTPLPSNLFVVDDYTVTIPKGFRIGRFKIKILLPQFDFSKTYAFALQIVDASGLTISGNFNKFFWTFNLANEWDGTYKSSLGYFYHPTVPRAIPTGADKNCYTSGPNKVETELGDFNGVAQPGAPYYITLTIAANNTVTITPGTGAAPSTSPVQGLTTLPTYTPFPGSTPSIYNNTWDPINKKFFLRYGYLGGALVNEWRVVEEVLTKQ